MAGVRQLLHPSRLIRRKALYSGVFGKSPLWKAVAAVVYGRQAFKRFFGSNTEVLDSRQLAQDAHLSVTTAKPMSRKQRKRAKRRGDLDADRRSAEFWAEAIAAEKLAQRSPSRLKFWKR